MSIQRKRQSLVGQVISTKMNKTVNVKVTRKISHPLYHKKVNRFKKYLAHVSSVVPENGDIVQIDNKRFYKYKTIFKEYISKKRAKLFLKILNNQLIFTTDVSKLSHVL